MKKEIKRIVKALETQGFYVERSGKGHLKVKNERGGTVYVMPSTPSDHRSLKNTVAELRRKGILPEDWR